MLSFVPSDGPRKLIRPSEALIELVSGSPDVAAYENSKRQLFEALSAKQVVAFVHLLERSQFYQIPHEYWAAGTFWDLRMSDTLFCLSDWGVPTALSGKDVVLDADDLKKLQRAIRNKAAPNSPVSTEALTSWLKLQDLESDVARTLWPKACNHFAEKRVTKRAVKAAVLELRGPLPPGRRPIRPKK